MDGFKVKVLLLSCVFCFGIWAVDNTTNPQNQEFQNLALSAFEETLNQGSEISFFEQGLPLAERLDRVLKIIQNHNRQNLSDQITSERTYRGVNQKENLGLPSYTTLSNWFKKEAGSDSAKGLSEFLFRQDYAERLDHILKIIQNHNRQNPDDKITNGRTYTEVNQREKLGLPSYTTLSNWYKEEAGISSKGLSKFLFRQDQKLGEFLASCQNNFTRH